MPDKAARSRPLIYIALPASYFIAGWLGLYLAVPPGYATAIFLPAGIAVAAMFVAGPVTLPGVFVGSLILNGWVGYSNNHWLDLIEVAAAFAIAAASTMQAGIGGSVLRRLVGYPASFDCLHDLVLYLAATPLICVTSATLAIGGLWTLGIVQSNSLLSNWLTWWVGDSLGVLVALPLILILFGAPRAIWQYRGPQVAIPMLISFGVFVIFFIYFQNWAVLVVGGLGTGLLGAFLLLMTGQAFRLKTLGHQLRDKDNELSAIINNSPFMLTRCSRDLRYLFVSEAYAGMIGRAPGDVVGKPIIEVMGEEGFKTIAPYIERVLAGERVEYESEVQFKSAGTRFLRVIYTPDRDPGGNIQGWVASIIDASDQVVADRVKQQLANIVESSDDAIVSEDLSGVIVSWNRGAERIFGYSAEEAIGKSITIIIPPELQQEEPKILANIRRGDRIEQYETKRRRKDGRIIDVSLSVSPIKNTEGKIVGASKIDRDITEHKQTQDRIAADFLALTRINQLSSQLMRSSAELQTSLSKILDVAIELSEAEMGNIQLLDEASGALTIASQRGFKEPFLTFFASVHAADNSACAAAIESRHRIVVEDVLKSEIFDAHPAQKVLLDAGVRAVTSTPLISSSGNVLGMVSTHFAEIHRPSARELSWMDLLSRQAADFLDRKRAEEIENTLVHEVQHRSNNLLGVVQAIVHRSLSGKSSLADAKAAIEGRLQSLARVNRKLTGARSERITIDEIVRSELEAFQERTSLQGARIQLGPQIAQRLTLAIHELATNAAKYGALCTAEGKVQVSWAVNGDGGQQSLKFKWQERGGPPISAPTGSGFGTTLLKTVLKEVRFEYAKEGLSCDITIPLSEIDSGIASRDVQSSGKRAASG